MKSKFVDPLWFGGDAVGDGDDDDIDIDIGRKCFAWMQNSLFYILFR